MRERSVPDQMNTYRVIVTGSRDFTNGVIIEDSLSFLRATYGAIGVRLVVVHGDCPTGADWYARNWAERRAHVSLPVIHEPHPADWKTHGKAAGPIRNEEMASLGADVCLAFPLGESRGTRDMINRARNRGIEVVEY